MKTKDELLKKLTATEKGLNNASKSIQSAKTVKKEQTTSTERSLTKINNELAKITENSA